MSGLPVKQSRGVEYENARGRQNSPSPRALIRLSLGSQRADFRPCSNSPPLAPRSPDTPTEELHAAVRLGNLPEVQRLITAGTPVDARDTLGSTPLLEAVWAGQSEIAEFLLSHGADPNAHHTEAGSTPLQYAVLTGRVRLVQLLLKSGAHVEGTFRDSQSLLHVAAAHGSVPIIDLLADANADLQALDANGNTPLDSAVLHGQLSAVAALLRHHANAAYVHPLDGRGALHEACMRGYANMLQPLIDAGASPTASRPLRPDPLDIALAYKNSSTVAALLRLGTKAKGIPGNGRRNYGIGHIAGPDRNRPHFVRQRI